MFLEHKITQHMRMISPRSCDTNIILYLFQYFNIAKYSKTRN